MKTLSVQQLARMKQAATALRMIGNIRNPQAMIDLVVPKDSPLRAMITGNDYDTITANILKQSGFDPEQVQQQLLAEGII